MLHLTSTKATIKMCSFYKTAIITGTAEVSTILSNNSNVTYKAKKQAVITIINCTFHSTNLMQELEHNTHLALINIFNGNFTMEGSSIENNVGERITFIRDSNINISNTTLCSNSAVNYVLCFVKDNIYLQDLTLLNNLGNFSTVHFVKN